MADFEAAIVTIGNLLASKSASEIWPAELSHIATEYGLSGSQVRQLALTLWYQAVAAAVADDRITREESDELAAIRRVLQISEDEAISAEQDIIHPRFKRTVAQVLADGYLSPEERQHIEMLADGLRFGKTELELLYAPIAGAVVQQHLTEAMSDNRLSPDELSSIGRTAENLGLKLEVQPQTEMLMRRYAELWKIENGTLPIITSSIRLQTGEVCHFQASAQWLELRTVTRRSNSGSVGYNVRIAKGMYYRSPCVRLSNIKEDVLTPIDSGELYITNKRIIFDGGRKNTTLRFTSLLGFQPYADGFALEKSTGRDPVLVIDGDVEQAQVILGTVLARA